jgi:hypothetical protein
MRKLLSTLFFLSISILISWLVLPSHYDVHYPHPLGPTLSAEIRHNFQEDIVANQDEVILLGDSGLARSVDQNELSSIINKRVYKIGFHGSGSAVWYLIEKNNIVNASYKPEYLVIFFRASMLTTPDFRVSGNFFPPIDEYAGADDSTLIQFAYVNPMTWLERLADQNIPLYGERLKLRMQIDNYLKYHISGKLIGDDRPVVDQALEDVLINGEQVNPNEAISNAESYLYTPHNLDFDTQLYVSFLPEIIRLCKENDIKLIFVHGRTLQYPTLNSEPRGSISYLNSLAEYLNSNDIPLIDFAYDVRLSPNLFSDQVHMNAAGKEFFTSLLGEKLISLIK